MPSAEEWICSRKNHHTVKNLRVQTSKGSEKGQLHEEDNGEAEKFRTESKLIVEKNSWIFKYEKKS